MVPTEVAMTAVLGGVAISLTAVIATVRVLGSRITNVRHDMNSRFDDVSSRFDDVNTRFGEIHDDLRSLRADVRHDMSEIRGVIGGLRKEFTARFDELEQR